MVKKIHHNNSIACTKCKSPLKKEDIRKQENITCHSCGTLLRIDLFPAMFEGRSLGEQSETLLDDNEAGCFYHSQKKAVVPCSACGRFLCALCDMELNGQHLCVSCMETGKKKQKIDGLQNRRILYDNVALLFSILPIIPFVTSAIALFMSVRYWKTPLSIIPRTRFRFLAAFFFASLQAMWWSAIFFL